MSINQVNLTSKRPLATQETSSILACWKEIASYVGKGVRTVQRWERLLGFPVRRTEPGSKSSVFAIPEEIDMWVLSRPFADGQLCSAELERTGLFRTLIGFQSENRELRLENAKLRLEKEELQLQLALDDSSPLSRYETF